MHHPWGTIHGASLAVSSLPSSSAREPIQEGQENFLLPSFNTNNACSEWRFARVWMIVPMAYGTSWYIMVPFLLFFCIWWLSQDRMQVPGEMCTCYCMLSWPTWQASRCLPLLEWLQKKESSKNPRSEVQTPACLSWCIFAHILTSFILLPCTMRTSCAIKGHWSLLAKAATSWIRPTCTVVFQTFGQTNAITPRKNQIAPKNWLENLWDGVQNGAIGGFWGVASVCMIQTRFVLLKLLENALVK